MKDPEASHFSDMGTPELLEFALETIQEARRELWLAASALEDLKVMGGQEPYPEVAEAVALTAEVAGHIAKRLGQQLISPALEIPGRVAMQQKPGSNTGEFFSYEVRFPEQKAIKETHSSLISPAETAKKSRPKLPEDYRIVTSELPQFTAADPDSALRLEIIDDHTVVIGSQTVELSGQSLFLLNTFLRSGGDQLSIPNILKAGYIYSQRKGSTNSPGSACSAALAQFMRKVNLDGQEPLVVSTDKTAARRNQLNPNLIINDRRSEPDENKDESRLQPTDTDRQVTTALDIFRLVAAPTPEPVDVITSRIEPETEPTPADIPVIGLDEAPDASFAVDMGDDETFPEAEPEADTQADYGLTETILPKPRTGRKKNPLLGSIVRLSSHDEPMNGKPTRPALIRHFETGFKENIRKFIPYTETAGLSNEELLAWLVPGRTLDAKIDFLTELARLNEVRYEKIGGIKQEGNWADRNSAFILRCLEAVHEQSDEIEYGELEQKAWLMTEYLLTRHQPFIRAKANIAFGQRNGSSLGFEQIEDQVKLEFLRAVMEFDFSFSDRESLANICIRTITPQAVLQAGAAG